MNATNNWEARKIAALEELIRTIAGICGDGVRDDIYPHVTRFEQAGYAADVALARGIAEAGFGKLLPLANLV